MKINSKRQSFHLTLNQLKKMTTVVSFLEENDNCCVVEKCHPMSLHMLKY